MNVVAILGTRPQFTKMSILLKLMNEDDKIDSYLVHTGQHYDFELSEIFFDELEIPKPDSFLGVKEEYHGKQTGKIISRSEEILLEKNPDIVIITGDSNTTLAGALAAIKLKIPVAHVEAGCRTFDFSMPEEVNRVSVDSFSSLLFSPTKKTTENLINEGIHPKRIFTTGNPLIDACKKYSDIANEKSDIMKELGLDEDFYLTTIHRPENVDEKKNFTEILSALKELDKTVIWPLHPRTEKMAKRFEIYEDIKNSENINILEPLGYLDFLELLNNCKVVLSDSGSVQQESIALTIPCLRLKGVVSVPDALDYVGIETVSPDKKKIIKALKDLGSKERLRRIKNAENPLGETGASKEIVKILLEKFSDDELELAPEISSGYFRIREISLDNRFKNKKIKEVEKELDVDIIALIEDSEVMFPDKNRRVSEKSIIRIREKYGD